MFRRLMVAAAVATAMLQAAWADAPVRNARPAIWTVHSAAGTAYLFGSIHILPPDVNWHSKAVETGIRKADAFVFEIPIDDTTQASVEAYVAKNGMLAAGQSLRAMLPSGMGTRYDTVVAQSGLPAADVDRMQPWLASVVLSVAALKAQNFDPARGPDTVIQAQAAAAGKPILAFETIEQQFELLASGDAKTNIDSLASTLDDIIDQPTLVDDMLAAWMSGDTVKLEKLLNGNLDKYPGARKTLLDDRNAAWVKRIAVLLKDKRTYFITVGAGHLVGPKGVPALLREAGYQVDGP
ncbi:MAG TPA: TraB/GumN family protein [Rhizomicrobium sp.]|nr:TraB/GumN family protein [Rhizomicrobium sp.]